MPCHTIRLPGGAVAIVRPAKCSVCRRLIRDYKLCDGESLDRKSRSCDAVLCTDCAVHREPDLDYCPRHPQEVA